LEAVADNHVLDELLLEPGLLGESLEDDLEESLRSGVLELSFSGLGERSSVGCADDNVLWTGVSERGNQVAEVRGILKLGEVLVEIVESFHFICTD
jgi:hypothetical protein